VIYHVQGEIDENMENVMKMRKHTKHIPSCTGTMKKNVHKAYPTRSKLGQTHGDATYAQPTTDIKGRLRGGTTRVRTHPQCTAFPPSTWHLLVAPPRWLHADMRGIFLQTDHSTPTNIWGCLPHSIHLHLSSILHLYLVVVSL
jgi:hypothetical protein